MRNWATFGLGTLIDNTSQTIVAALLARISEKNSEIRGEAILGLTLRKHPKAKLLIKKELKSRSVNTLILESAEKLADPDLYPLLLKWQRVDGDDLYFHGVLEDAITACTPKKQ